MDWRKATRTVFHEKLGIDKCPAEIENRKDALNEAVRMTRCRRVFLSNIGKATSALGLYALTVGTPWNRLVVNTSKNIFQTGIDQWDRTRYVFSGSTGKTTESFYIPTDEWKITYEVTGDPTYEEYMMFMFFVYPKESIIFVEVGSIPRFGKDYTVVHHGPGNFYLRVASSYCNWRITVTAPP